MITELTEEQKNYSKLHNLRFIRETMLNDSDNLINLTDYFSAGTIVELQTWRQALRDLPANIVLSNVEYGSTFSGIPMPPQELVDKRKIVDEITFLGNFLQQIYRQQNPQENTAGVPDPGFVSPSPQANTST